MGDPLSTAASVIAVLQLSSEVANYIRTAAGATEDRNRLRDEIRACEYVLQQLDDRFSDVDEKGAWTEIMQTLQSQDGPLGRLQATLAILKQKLKPPVGLIRGAVASLKWPLTEKEVNKLFEVIEREKALLQIALSSDAARLLKEVSKTSKDNRALLVQLCLMFEQSVETSAWQYEDLKVELKRIQASQHTLHADVKSVKAHHIDQRAVEHKKRVLDWLSPVDHYAQQQSDYVSRREEGTGQWLLDSDEYGSWVSGNTRTLFCPGIPGAGKTILTSIVVDELITNSAASVGIAFLYCSFKRQDQQTHEHFLLSLLRQLAEHLKVLPSGIQDLHSKHKGRKTRPSLSEIRDALTSTAAEFPRAFFLIDALDECQTMNRKRLLDDLFLVQKQSNSCIFATARPLPDIVAQFSGFPTLEVHASDHDISSYIDSHLSILPSFVSRNPDLQQGIKDAIMKSVDGMFLLVKLYMDSLVGKRSPKAVKAALARLPSGSNAYDFAYNDAMERIKFQKPDQTELAMEALTWITFAKWPLNVQELQHALATTDPEQVEIDEEDFPDIEDILSICAGLITLDEETGIVRLVHYTAQEYFQRTDWLPEAHARIFKACITYLKFEAFGSGVCKEEKEFKVRTRDFCFYRYASVNWGHHLQEGLSGSVGTTLLHCDRASSMSGELVSMALELMRNTSHFESAWQCMLGEEPRHNRGYDFPEPYLIPSDITVLQVAAFFEIVLLAEYCLRDITESATTNNKNSFGYTALHYAAQRNSYNVAELILSVGNEVDINPQTKERGLTPLYLAVWYGHIQIVELLLRHERLDVDLCLLPPIYSLFPGFAEIDRFKNPSRGLRLIGPRLDWNPEWDEMFAYTTQEIAYTPFWLAVALGYTDIVKLLFGTGKISTNLNWGVLNHAAERGYDEIVRFLVDETTRGRDVVEVW